MPVCPIDATDVVITTAVASLATTEVTTAVGITGSKR